MTENLDFFKPWKGSNYGSGPYGKLLLIGESFYTWEEQVRDNREYANNTFIKVIQDCIDGSFYSKAYTNLGKIFRPDKPMTLFNEIAFVNAIQNVMFGEADTQPSPEDIKTIVPGFWYYLETLEPEKVIFCSIRLWEKWLGIAGIDYDERSKPLNIEIKIGGRRSNVWKYNYTEGKSCLAIGIHHPSPRGFSPRDWTPIVNEFLSM